MSIRMVDIDIAKNRFQLHGVDGKGKVVSKRRLSRDKLAAFVGNLTQCTIAMESCGGAHYRAVILTRRKTSRVCSS
jgi:transposase